MRKGNKGLTIQPASAASRTIVRMPTLMASGIVDQDVVMNAKRGSTAASDTPTAPDSAPLWTLSCLFPEKFARYSAPTWGTLKFLP